jgi:hypothetical protein
LTTAAIANSREIQTLEQRLTLLDGQTQLTDERRDYAEAKLWTNYLPTSSNGGSVLDFINPFAWIKNLAGGGDMQRDRLAIGELEVKSAALTANRAELERQLEQQKILLGEKVLKLVLVVEKSDRALALHQSKASNFNVSYQVFRVRFKHGEGTMDQYLAYQNQLAQLNEAQNAIASQKSEAIRELEQATGLLNVAVSPKKP